MSGKIGVSKIFENYKAVFHNTENDSVIGTEIVKYIVLPVFGGAVLSIVKLSTQTVMFLTTMFSIFGAFLFYLQMLIIAIREYVEQRQNISVDSQNQNRLAAFRKMSLEMSNTVSFCILLTIFSLALLFLWHMRGFLSILLGIPYMLPVLSHIGAGILYVNVLVFLCAVFMLLKRSAIALNYCLKPENYMSKIATAEEITMQTPGGENMQFRDSFKGGVLAYDENNKLIESWTGGISNLHFESENIVFNYAQRVVILNNRFVIEVCYDYDDAVTEINKQKVKRDK